jgi:hypothetical protein
MSNALERLSAASRQRLDRLTKSPPLLHNWKGAWRLGGFKADEFLQLVRMAARASSGSGGTFAETGAGLSTLGLLCVEPEKVISVAPAGDLFERILLEARNFDIDPAPLQHHVQPSELVLPSLVLEREPFIDFALIDGGHNFTHVWVDFVYFNYGLRRGGIVAVDDIQLFPCQQLALYLNSNRGWEVAGRSPKTVYFRKKTDRRLEGDFGSSPYVLANSLIKRSDEKSSAAADPGGADPL